MVWGYLKSCFENTEFKEIHTLQPIKIEKLKKEDLTVPKEENKLEEAKLEEDNKAVEVTPPVQEEQYVNFMFKHLF